MKSNVGAGSAGSANIGFLSSFLSGAGSANMDGGAGSANIGFLSSFLSDLMRLILAGLNRFLSPVERDN